jgi:hypothetical protein
VVVAGAAASTELKFKKARQKNQATSFYFLGSAASKLLRAADVESAMAPRIRQGCDVTP